MLNNFFRDNKSEQLTAGGRPFFRGQVAILFDEQDYLDEVNAADLIQHSPIRRTHVIESDGSFIVRLNVSDAYSSELRYERWVITKNGTGWTPNESLTVAQLHYAV